MYSFLVMPLSVIDPAYVDQSPSIRSSIVCEKVCDQCQSVPCVFESLLMPFVGYNKDIKPVETCTIIPIGSLLEQD